MKGTSLMQEVWIIKAVAFLPKLVAAIAGAILALVLSGDISSDGYIKINRSVVFKFSIALIISLFGGAFIIETYHLEELSRYAQGFIMFLVAVFGLLIIGIFYQAIAMLRGKPLSQIASEVSSAFISIFFKRGA